MKINKIDTVCTYFEPCEINYGWGQVMLAGHHHILSIFLVRPFCITCHTYDHVPNLLICLDGFVCRFGFHFLVEAISDSNHFENVVRYPRFMSKFVIDKQWW